MPVLAEEQAECRVEGADGDSVLLVFGNQCQTDRTPAWILEPLRSLLGHEEEGLAHLGRSVDDGAPVVADAQTASERACVEIGEDGSEQLVGAENCRGGRSDGGGRVEAIAVF